MTRLIGLDVGTTSIKAVSVDASGGAVLDSAQAEYPLLTPRDGWAEQDPDEWWRATEEVLDRLDPGHDAASIGLSGQMHGLVALDSADRPLRPAILWNDQRTEAQVAEITERVGADRLLELTGNRALTGFTAPKLLWLREHEPDVWESIRSVLLPKDYVRLRLCGERATDVTDASGTLLFDVANRAWSAELCAELEVPTDWLPVALESPEVSGRTEEGVPVAAGAGDQAAGAVGVGVVAPGPVSLVLGTSGVVFGALDRFAHDARLHSFCHALPEVWHAMGVMLSAAGSLRWWGEVCHAELDQLLREAERWPPGAEGLLFAPYLAGERTPHADPHARGAFTGLSHRHDRGALSRAVLEGVACGLGEMLDLVRELAGEPSSARASGGGARSRLWLEIVASVLGIPVARMQVDEGAAYGAALLGGVAAGVFETVAEAASLARVREEIEPRREWVDAYAEVSSRFHALYPALKPLAPESDGGSAPA